MVGDHKFIINETAHIQESEYGHVVVKVKTVDIKSASDEDTTEESSEEPTVRPDVVETDESNESDSESVTEANERETDESVDTDENSGSFDDDNDILLNSIAYKVKK